MSNRCSRTPRKAAVAAVVGTTVEWYDFFVYSTAAVLVFGPVFFPDSLTPLQATLLAFATTAFGYLGRPIGALLFGHLGDRFGRKPVLASTIVLMGVATTAIGVLPSYETVGLLAPIALVTMRLLQGIAVGGEWGGAAAIAVEHAPRQREGLFGSFTQVGSPMGALLSTGAFTLAQQLIGPLSEGAWRAPFIVSAVLVVVGVLIRTQLAESPEFVEAQQAGATTDVPLITVWRHHRGTVLLAAGGMAIATGGYYITSSSWLAYATGSAGIDETFALNVLSAVAAFEICFTLLAGLAADRFTPRRVILAGLIATPLVGLSWFGAANSTGLTVILPLAATVALTNGLHYGPLAVFVARLFPAEIRYSAMSTSCQLSALVAGGLSPVIASGLFALRGGSPDLVLVYLLLLSGLAAVCVGVVRSDAERRPRAPASPVASERKG